MLSLLEFDSVEFAYRRGVRVGPGGRFTSRPNCLFFDPFDATKVGAGLYGITMPEAAVPGKLDPVASRHVSVDGVVLDEVIAPADSPAPFR